MRKGIAFAALDLMGSLLLVVYALINPPVIEARSAIETPGRWVIVLTWPEGDNDLDLWLRQPNGRKLFWSNPRSQQAHLEQDDLGIRADSPGENRERIVIRAILPGEHTVNVHGYAAYESPVTATVTLWRLQGADRKVRTVRLVIQRNGQEQTAFRFTLHQSGELADLNRLPARLLG